LAELLWQPSPERVSSSNMTSFSRYVEELINRRINSYDDLYKWSITEIEEFWKSIWVMSGVIHSKNYDSIFEGGEMPDGKWFDGARLNFAENMLRYRDNKIAIVSLRENSPVVRLSYVELYDKTARCANWLKEAGFKEGDRAAGFISNIPEAVVGMLATTSIGGIWTSCSPDFGLKGVIDRFGQTDPKILFASESYRYNGKLIDCREKIKEIAAQIPSIEKIVLIPQFYDFNTKCEKREIGGKLVYFDELMERESKEIEFAQLPFDHPVYIMYSSGTTGKPKCIVHGAGGTLLQHYKELALHTNLTRHDVISYYTTCGWMMWNWLVSGLNIGTTILLYEGSPVYPVHDVLWKKIEEEGVTVFGTSPKYLSICEKNKVKPKLYDLKKLCTILSTGSPLSEDNFRWVYREVKEDVQLASISGGTDIISCFVLGNPNLPVYTGEIQCRGLGMKVEAWSEEGESVTGEKGELVCTAPFPSMPVFFWNDEKGNKYREAYFQKYKGVWRHGDYIEITERGSVIIYGRSDATLNPGGVRIGTSEIYNVVESMEEVTDSVVIGQKYMNDTRIVLFLVLKPGNKLDINLQNRVKNEIRRNLTPRHMPALIVEVKDIPRTISGKKVELAVTKIVNGEEIDNKDALANPESLEEFIRLREKGLSSK
jgi:acetoacetyl-CoA synthetase